MVRFWHMLTLVFSVLCIYNQLGHVCEVGIPHPQVSVIEVMH